MKTFKDLVFKKHHNSLLGERARLKFKNDYSVSVITGGYGSKSSPYELAILYKDDLCYTTGITDGVLGYLTKNEVTKIMKQVQEL